MRSKYYKWNVAILFSVLLIGNVTMLKASDKAGLKEQSLVIFPHPWKIICGKESVKVENVGIQNIGGQDRLKNALEKYFKNIGISYGFMKDGESFDAFSTQLILCDDSDMILKKRLENVFPGIFFSDLGEEGYFLSIGKKGNSCIIYIGGNTEQARFYGLQTLKQMLDKESKKIQIADIADKPTLSIRGMPMGVQWFEKRDEAVKRLSSLKCNHIHNPDMAWALDHKLGANGWRKPFTGSDKKILKNYLELCKENFIDVTLSFGPRGTPPLQYSSDNDINIIVGKMSELYELGFRDFCINFDDLQNTEEHGLVVPEDIKKFDNDFGKAHYYFVMEIYIRLKRIHGDASLKMLPLYYGGFMSLKEPGERYLRTIGRLPKEIEFVTCPYSFEEIQKISELTGRTPFIWDNYYATWGDCGKLPVFIPPIIRSNRLSNVNIKGYIFLPSLPKWEDIIMTSWFTSADFMWSPERYNPDKSFYNAMLKVPCASENISDIKEYSDYILELLKYTVPATNKVERLTWLNENIEKLKAWQNKLKNMIPPHVFKEVCFEIAFHLKNLQEIKQDQEGKSFPVIVRQADGPIKIDGVLDEKAWGNAEKLTGFTNLKGDMAKNQTEAYFLYDKDFLYLGMVCQEPFPEQVVAKRKERDSNVYQDDCIEMFLDVKQARSEYFHIAVNTLGTVYDAFGGGLSASCWNGNYTIATQKGDASWTVEMAIPLKDLGVSHIQPGMRWNFNIARERWVKPTEVSSYSLLLRNGFHNPTRFWTLEFK